MLSAVLNRLSDDHGMIKPELLAGELHVPLEDLARLAQVHRNSFRTPDSPKAQAGLRAVANVLQDAADILGGNVGKAALWLLTQPVPGFGYKTAADMLRSGNVEAVRLHLNAFREGGYA